MCAGIVNAEKEELWIDQREEVGVGGELNTPLEEGTLSSGGRRQANVAAAGRGGRALPAGNTNEQRAKAGAVSGRIFPLQTFLIRVFHFALYSQ